MSHEHITEGAKFMNINISGKNITVSDYLRRVTGKKARKLERYFKPDTEMQVTLSIEKSRASRS